MTKLAQLCLPEAAIQGAIKGYHGFVSANPHDLPNYGHDRAVTVRAPCELRPLRRTAEYGESADFNPSEGSDSPFFLPEAPPVEEQIMFSVRLLLHPRPFIGGQGGW